MRYELVVRISVKLTSWNEADFCTHQTLTFCKTSLSKTSIFFGEWIWHFSDHSWRPPSEKLYGIWRKWMNSKNKQWHMPAQFYVTPLAAMTMSSYFLSIASVSVKLHRKMLQAKDTITACEIADFAIYLFLALSGILHVLHFISLVTSGVRLREE